MPFGHSFWSSQAAVPRFSKSTAPRKQLDFPCNATLVKSHPKWPAKRSSPAHKRPGQTQQPARTIRLMPLWGESR